MNALPTDVNPVEIAIAMLTEALPGFESRFVDGRDAVGIRGEEGRRQGRIEALSEIAEVRERLRDLADEMGDDDE